MISLTVICLKHGGGGALRLRRPWRGGGGDKINTQFDEVVFRFPGFFELAQKSSSRHKNAIFGTEKT